MNFNVLFGWLTAILCFVPGALLLAQPLISIYTDVGKNNASDGLYVKTAGQGQYQLGKNVFESAFQLDVKSPNPNVLSGVRIYAGREVLSNKFPLEVGAFFLQTWPSEVLRETNWGAMVKMKRRHFQLKLGTNFRTIAHRKKAVRLYDLNAEEKIHENWNVMYSIGYQIKPTDHIWNLGLTITNIDHFLINQETNPVILLHSKYKVKEPVSIFMEAWYKSAGAFNLSVNYFGFFVRTGVIWKII